MSTIRAVLFDLDGTLCAYRRTTNEVLRDAFEAAGVEPFFDADDFERWLPRVRGTSPLDLREKCFGGIAEENGMDRETGYAVAASYEERDPSGVRPLPGAGRALETLSDEFRLGVVTNGPDAKQRRKLESLGFTDRFDSIVCATAETALKPDPDPFHRALEELDTAPEATVLVGNSLESDVAGARNAGVTPVWVASEVPDSVAEKPGIIINSVAELAERPFPWQND